MADEFYLKPEEIQFIGHVPDEEMFALYRAADVFLSLSEHEGFCLPLVESMIFDLPVIALASTAVPYTLGEAGILIRDSRPDHVAELVDIVAHDQGSESEAGRERPAGASRNSRNSRREEFLLGRIERTHPMKIAFVIQRYGKEVMGGSELHCRLIAERLVDHGYDCTVFTTTAKDYVTWKNEYPPGESVLNGVAIKRFDVDKPRESNRSTGISDWIFLNPHKPGDELSWLEEQGPNSPALIEALEGERDETRPFRFFHLPLLQYLLGSAGRSEEPTILVPTAHDEPALRLGIMKEVFSRPAAFMFNTEAEKAMLGRYFSFAGQIPGHRRRRRGRSRSGSTARATSREIQDAVALIFSMRAGSSRGRAARNCSIISSGSAPAVRTSISS